MNALIFLVPEDIVDVRPRLVRPSLFLSLNVGLPLVNVDPHVRRKLDEHCLMNGGQEISMQEIEYCKFL